MAGFLNLWEKFLASGCERKNDEIVKKSKLLKINSTGMLSINKQRALFFQIKNYIRRINLLQFHLLVEMPQTQQNIYLLADAIRIYDNRLHY